jgi:excisionase family DNA binding protein
MAERADSWTTKQLSEVANVSIRYIRYQIEAGKLEAYKVGRDWLIPREAGQQWLDQRQLKQGKH